MIENYSMLKIGYHRYLLPMNSAVKILALLSPALVIDGYGDALDIKELPADTFSVANYPNTIITEINKAKLLNMTLGEYQNAKQRTDDSQDENPTISE